MDYSERAIPEVFTNAIVVMNELFLKELPGDKVGILSRLGAIAGVNIISKSKGTLAAQGSWKKIIAFEDVIRKSLRNWETDAKIISTVENPVCDGTERSVVTSGGNRLPTLTNATKHVENCCDKINASDVDTSIFLDNSENPSDARILQISTVPISVISAADEASKKDDRTGNEIYVNITLSGGNSLSFATHENNIGNDYPAVDEITSRVDCSAVMNGNIEDKVTQTSKLVSEKLSEKDKRKLYEQQTPYKFFCTVCSFKSKRESHYKKHLQLHRKGATKLFVCIQCGFRTIRMGHLRRHELQHSSKALRCPGCPYTTDCSTFLQRHQRIKHSSNSKQKSHGEKFLSCSHCTYVTSQPHFLKRHMRVHGIGKDPIKNLTISYECDKCAYKTRRKEHFERHQRDVHSELRPFLCDACGKAFKRADALRQHRAARHQPLISNDGKIVSGSSSSLFSIYCCPHCSKPCRSRAHLRDHLATHSDERSFLCEICGSSFKTRAVQRKHVATVHANPKAFPCHKCVRRFSTKYALLRHLKIHGLGKDEHTRLTSKAETAVLNCLGISRPKEGCHMDGKIEPSALLLGNETEHASENHISIHTKEIEMESHDRSTDTGQPSHQLVTVMPIIQGVEERKDSSNGGVALDMVGELHSVNGAALTRTAAPSETTTALLYLTHDFTQY
ncbi:hypothetical protein J437_LFUL016362 [Ladona fulva]|uniref:C2H2-type domain-containing protein n=1 Tax=Ladona fulva TaxID=123851 RepID=A0A8K0KIN4_LADFU|nr:hypothetical protein J437_LFUL016362 [Ladona fulva]